MLTLLLAASALAPAALSAVELPDRKIRAGDIARARGYEAVVVGALPQGANSVVIDEAAARRLLRNRFPQSEFTLHFKGRIALRHASTGPGPARRCLRAASDLASGEPVMPDNTEQAPCTADQPAASLAYDEARGLPVARQTIPAGTYLGPLRLRSNPPLPAGQAMTLRFATGPVVVERAVVTLQPATPGKRLFVKTEDNAVISAMVAADSAGAKP